MLDSVFPLGLGANHFPVMNTQDIEGLEASVQLVLRAIGLGVRYIDVAESYSRGMAYRVLREAFHRTSAIGLTVTAKYKYQDNLTTLENAAKARTATENALRRMEIPQAAFVCWSIQTKEEFEQIMAPGGVYDEAVKMKREGLISHIACSCHARLGEMREIAESGAFEAMTVSMSLLSAASMQEVLQAASDHGLALITMNSNGGGIIPENPDFFRFACANAEETVVAAGLRFLMAHKAIKLVLAGPASLAELDASAQPFLVRNPEPDAKRLERVYASLREIDGFCTGCTYCRPCPKGIPTSDILYHHNMLLMGVAPTHNRTEPAVLENIAYLSLLERDTGFVPETDENPCVDCGVCERRCTQGLKIRETVDDYYRRVRAAAFSLQARKKRLDELLNRRGYKTVGVYPSGGYAEKVIKTYKAFFGEPEFTLCLFDSSPDRWGTVEKGLPVYGPQDIMTVKPDCILVSNYKFQEEIRVRLLPYQQQGIPVLTLHGVDDVPWLY